MSRRTISTKRASSTSRSFSWSTEGTCVVISHDSEFLNAFTTGVLYLDIFTRKIEQYPATITMYSATSSSASRKRTGRTLSSRRKYRRIKTRQTSLHRRAGRCVSSRRRCAPKSRRWRKRRWMCARRTGLFGRLRYLHKEELSGVVFALNSYSVLSPKGKPVVKKANVSLRKNNHLLLRGPNGIGKSTLLEAIAKGVADGALITEG